MLKAYLRRYDGTTQEVTLRHQGQHLGVHEGKVRFARLFWDREDPKDSDEEAAYAVLEEAVPLLDTLIVTRVSPVNGERAVFHGTLTEASADGQMISLMGADNPAQERLYDQPWWNNAPLYPSDQAAPERTSFAEAAAAGQHQQQPQHQAPPQGVQTLGGVPLASPGQVLPLGQGAQLRVTPHPESADPAARPGGHPAAPPAGPWQALPQPAAQQA